MVLLTELSFLYKCLSLLVAIFQSTSVFQQQQQQQQPVLVFNGPLSGTTQVSWYQKGQTNLDLLEQQIESGGGISWAMCRSAPRPRQITMQAPHQSFTGRMPFLPPNQQLQITKGMHTTSILTINSNAFTSDFSLMYFDGTFSLHLACKKTEWLGAGMVICLGQGADLHMAQLMPLPLYLLLQ